MQKKKRKKEKEKGVNIYIVLLTSLKKNVFQSHENHSLVNSMGYMRRRVPVQRGLGPCMEGKGSGRSQPCVTKQ